MGWKKLSINTKTKNSSLFKRIFYFMPCLAFVLIFLLYNLFNFFFVFSVYYFSYFSMMMISVVDTKNLKIFGFDFFFVAFFLDVSIFLPVFSFYLYFILFLFCMTVLGYSARNFGDLLFYYADAPFFFVSCSLENAREGFLIQKIFNHTHTPQN
jgi:hypothetical protein